MYGSDSDGLICRFMLVSIVQVSIVQVLLAGVLFVELIGRDGEGTLR